MKDSLDGDNKYQMSEPDFHELNETKIETSKSNNSCCYVRAGGSIESV